MACYQAYCWEREVEDCGEELQLDEVMLPREEGFYVLGKNRPLMRTDSLTAREDRVPGLRVNSWFYV